MFLYVIADFGAVQLLRYDTLTRAIYANRLLDPAGRRRPQPGARRCWRSSSWSPSGALAAGRALGRAPRRARPLIGGPRALAGRPALAFVGGLLGARAGRRRSRCSSTGPCAASARAPRRPTPSSRTRSAWSSRPLNTDGRQRRPRPWSRWPWCCRRLPDDAPPRPRRAGAADALVTGGFALPGLVDRPRARVLDARQPRRRRRALPDAPAAGRRLRPPLRGAGAARRRRSRSAGVPRRLDDAARTLGPRPAARGSRRSSCRSWLPGLAAGAGLVLLSAMKELPVTLLLAPAGFPTLATRIWSAAEDAFWADAEHRARWCWWRSRACSPGCSSCAATGRCA